MKKRLDEVGGNRVNELHAIIWAYRTATKEATWDTPVALVYGTNTIIIVEVGLSTERIEVFSQDSNDEMLREELDLVYEKRERAREKMQELKTMIKIAYDRKVNQQRFQADELLLKQEDALQSTGKLGPNWEGPYKVTTVLSGEAYKLTDMEGKNLPRPWNINHLKKFYVWQNGLKNPT